MPRAAALGLSLLAVWLTVGACRQVPTPSRDAEADAVRAANSRAVAALQRRDIDAAMALYADEPVLQLPGMAGLTNRESIRAFYAGGSDTSVVFEATPELIRVAASGDLAYLVGRKREVCKDASGQVASEGKVLSVWEKRDGTWKIVALSASNNAPTSRGCL